MALMFGGILKYGLGGRGVSMKVYTAASPRFIARAFNSTVGVSFAETIQIIRKTRSYTDTDEKEQS